MSLAKIVAPRRRTGRVVGRVAGQVRPGLNGPGRRPPHEVRPDPGPGFEGHRRCLSREVEGLRPGPERGARVCASASETEAVAEAGPPPPPPCPAWVTKPLRPLLGDVRVGGSGGRGGGAATTSAAASTAAAFAGGRADVRGGGAPGAKRLGACGPLVAAAATAGDGVSGEGAAGQEQPLRRPAVAKGVLVGGGLSRSGPQAQEGCGGGDMCSGRRLGLRGMGQRRRGRLPVHFAGWSGASGRCSHRHDW